MLLLSMNTIFNRTKEKPVERRRRKKKNASSTINTNNDSSNGRNHSTNSFRSLHAFIIKSSRINFFFLSISISVFCYFFFFFFNTNLDQGKPFGCHHFFFIYYINYSHLAAIRMLNTEKKNNYRVHTS